MNNLSPPLILEKMLEEEGFSEDDESLFRNWPELKMMMSRDKYRSGKPRQHQHYPMQLPMGKVFNSRGYQSHPGMYSNFSSRRPKEPEPTYINGFKGDVSGCYSKFTLEMLNTKSGQPLYQNAYKADSFRDEETIASKNRLQEKELTGIEFLNLPESNKSRVGAVQRFDSQELEESATPLKGILNKSSGLNPKSSRRKDVASRKNRIYEKIVHEEEERTTVNPLTTSRTKRGQIRNDMFSSRKMYGHRHKTDAVNFPAGAYPIHKDFQYPDVDHLSQTPSSSTASKKPADKRRRRETHEVTCVMPPEFPDYEEEPYDVTSEDMRKVDAALRQMELDEYSVEESELAHARRNALALHNVPGLNGYWY